MCVQRFCRVCETVHGLNNMFHEENEELLLMLRSVANISILVDDMLPKYICSLCARRLRGAYDFQVQCQVTDQKLRANLQYKDKPVFYENVELCSNNDHRIYETEVNSEAVDECITSFDNIDQKLKTNLQYEDKTVLYENVELCGKNDHRIYETEVDSGAVDECITSFDDIDDKDDAKELINDDICKEEVSTEEKLKNTQLDHDDIILVDYTENNEVDPVLDIASEETIIQEFIVEPCEEYISEIPLPDTVHDLEPEIQDTQILDADIEMTDQLRKTDKKSIQIDKKLQKCPYCGDKFISLADHLARNVHANIKAFACILCKKRFRFKQALEVHMQLHASQPTYEREDSENSFDAIADVDANMQLEHTEISNDSEKVGPLAESDLMIAKISDEHQYHAKQHHTDLGKVISMKERMQKDHSKGKASATIKTKFKCTYRRIRTNYPCDICSEIFKSVGELRAHRKTHGKHGYECSFCGKTFKARYSLRNHMGMHTGNKVPCHLCDKKFSTRSNLARHVERNHNQKKPYPCEICGVYFGEKFTLKMHIASHTKERNYECDECGKRLKTALTLKLHKERHIDPDLRKPMPTRKVKEQICICKYCGKKSFTLPAHLAHLTYHSANKKFKCSMCPKRFHFKQYLVRHMRSHTDDRPYPCDICGKSFHQSGHLKNHINAVHAQLRPYKCSYCQKAFTSNGTLTIHERLHTGEKPFKCDQCDAEYIDGKYLKKHKLRIHGEPRMDFNLIDEIGEVSEEVVNEGVNGEENGVENVPEIVDTEQIYEEHEIAVNGLDSYIDDFPDYADLVELEC